MTAPCYLCGTPSVLEGLCSDCFNKEHPLVSAPALIQFLSCKRCGSVKVPGGWQAIVDANPGTEEMLEKQLELVLTREINRLVDTSEMYIEIDKKLDRVLHITLVVSGQSNPSLESHEERYPIEIRLEFGTCETCGMMSGGYYEAILQVRADGRFLTEKEEDEIRNLVTSRTLDEYGKDDKAFVIHVSETKYGLDFMIGSEHLCKQIADELQSLYLAERKENFKLIGQHRGGKDKFRITILIRLQRYTPGDFIRVDRQPCQVLDIGRSGVSCISLLDSGTFSVNPKSARWRTIEFLADRTDTREYMIISRTRSQPVQLMDSKTFEIYEVDDALLPSEMENGEKLQALMIDDTLYPVVAKESTID